jgi:hypothetical protein
VERISGSTKIEAMIRWERLDLIAKMIPKKRIVKKMSIRILVLKRWSRKGVRTIVDKIKTSRIKNRFSENF